MDTLTRPSMPSPYKNKEINEWKKKKHNNPAEQLYASAGARGEMLTIRGGQKKTDGGRRKGGVSVAEIMSETGRIKYVGAVKRRWPV